MAREVSVGIQEFAEIREGGCFYIDKTAFIREWWKGKIKVTLITRPRRFGKTLMMSTVETFFSTGYANRPELFEGLDVWNDEEMRSLQGTYPVIFLTLSGVRGDCFASLYRQLRLQISRLFTSFRWIKSAGVIEPEELDKFSSLMSGSDDTYLMNSIYFLCDLLYRVYGKKPIVLLDEYDTPLHQAWINNCWKEMSGVLGVLFHETFKNNTLLGRAILTGITRVSKESLFSEMNNLEVNSLSVPKYATYFGFTEKEVIDSMNEYDLTDYDGVKAMYDGYAFGKTSGIYNPWSISCYLKDPRLVPWWSNTSDNALAGKLIKEGTVKLKQNFQTLLKGGTITSQLDEQIVFNRLTGNPKYVWSLLLASGYLKPVDINNQEYKLQIVNGEVKEMFANLISEWFADTDSYDNFVDALLDGNLDEMNAYMNMVAFNCFSIFDTGGNTELSEPERFYHGFVLGLLVALRNRYILTSNRESGLGRYDVILEPRNSKEDLAFIIEFKVHAHGKGKSLETTVRSALAQIEKKGYDQILIERGIPAERIRKYGFAFKGKKVLIG